MTSPPDPSPAAGTFPERPDYPAGAPPVLRGTPPPPRAVLVSFGLWIASFLAGLGAVGYTLTVRDDLRAALARDITADRPSISPELLDRVISTTLTVGWSVIAGVIALELLLAVLMRYRRAGARVSLALIAVLGTLATAFSQVSVHERVQVLLLAQAGLVVIAIIVMFLPRANAWFRRHGE